MKKPIKPKSLANKPVKSTCQILEIQSEILNGEDTFTIEDVLNEMNTIKNNHPTFDNKIHVKEEWDYRYYVYKIEVITVNENYESETAKYEKDLSAYNAELIKYHEYQLKTLKKLS